MNVHRLPKAAAGSDTHPSLRRLGATRRTVQSGQLACLRRGAARCCCGFHCSRGQLLLDEPVSVDVGARSHPWDSARSEEGRGVRTQGRRAYRHCSWCCPHNQHRAGTATGHARAAADHPATRLGDVHRAGRQHPGTIESNASAVQVSSRARIRALHGDSITHSIRQPLERSPSDFPGSAARRGGFNSKVDSSRRLAGACRMVGVARWFEDPVLTYTSGDARLLKAAIGDPRSPGLPGQHSRLQQGK